MDPDSDARLPSSGPQRRTRAARVSLNVTPSASSSSLAASPSTPGGKSSGANVRGSPYARPTPSPRAPAEGDHGAASTGTPGLFASLFRGALGSIGWGGASTTPSKKQQTPKDGKTAAAAAVEQGDAFASIGRSPAPNLATPSTRASSRLTTSRSLSHLAPGPRTSTSYAPSPLRGSTTASINNIHNASGSGSGSGTGGAYPPSAWPGASNPVGTSRRSRSRGPSRDASPALTNVSAHVAIRRQPSVGMSSRTSGLYQASTGGYGQGQGRPVSMVAMPTGHSMSEFGAAGASSGGAGAGAGGASFHVPNFSPFAAPAYYRAGSVSASSRGGTPVRRAGSLVPGYAPGTGTGAGAPSPLGPGSRAGSVGGESVGTVFTSGGTPLRRADRRSLNLSSTVVRRTPSMFSISGSGSGSGANHLGLPVGGRGSGRGTTPRRSEGEAMLEQYMKSAEGEEDLERMSVQPGSRMGTPLAQNAYGGRQGSLRAASLLPGAGGARNRSVAPSPSPGPVRGAAGAFRSAGFGRLYSVTPSRGGSPAVGQKRGVESVQGEEWERLDSLSIEPSRKKQVIFNEQEGRYMTVEQMRALQPRRAGPWNTADRILNELEGVRTPLGDSQTLARRALLTGMPLPAHVAVPEPRANISSAKAAANRMLPPSLPLSSGSRAAGNSQSLKPIGPYARRQALHLRMAKRLADQAEGGNKGLSLREQVEAIRARDGDIGAGRTAQVEKKAGGDEDMDEDATATAAAEEEEEKPEPEPEVQQKKTRKGKGKAADVSADADMAGVTPEAESLGSKRTLRPRKAKTPAAEPAPTEKKGGVSKMAKVSAAPPAAEKSDATPEPAKASASSILPSGPAPAPVVDSAAKETAASTLKPKPAKSDAFQVLSDSAARPGSSTSSLRQRTEKKFRQHEKSSTGRFGIDDDDEEGEDGVGNGEDEVTAEELEKISVPKILFPAGFKFGGTGASAGASGSGATSAAPAKSASLFGTPSTASSSTTSALKPPAVNLPALPPPTDLQPATSLFDRMGDKASSSSADFSASPKKVVTFATPISSVTTFQTGSSAGGSSGDTSSAPPASASGFQFKAPTSGAPMFPPAPKAAASTPSDFFSQPTGITAPASSDAGSTPAAAGVPNFFSTSLKKLDTDKPSAPAPAPAAQPSSSGTAVPNFFASSLGKPAGSESQAGSSAATTTTTAPSVPNFFASSSKKSDDASGAAAPASGFSSSAGALKAFTGFGAPAASTSTPAASAPAAAPAKSMFGSFGGAAAAAPASGAPKASAPPTFSFGAPAATSTATTSTNAAPAPTPSASSIFGSMSAAPSSSSVAATSLFGSSPASKKRSADEDASGSGEHGSSSTGESSAKKPFGGLSFGASTPATPPASSAASSLFGQQASKPAAPGFQFGKSTPTPAPAAMTSTFGGGFGSAAATNGDSGGNSMDTGSPPKAGGFGFNFGGGASAGAGGTSSMFGSSNNNGNSGSAPTSATPTSMGFGQSQPAPASGGFAFGGSKPATPTSNNVFGSGMNGGGSMTNSTSAAPPFGFGQANAQSSAPAQNGFGSNAGSGMTLNTKPNFNFGGGSSTPSAGPGGVFTFGSNTPTQSTTPTLTPASAPFQFGGNSAANAAPSASNGSFAFGAGQQQNNTASQGGMGGFAFGASSGPTGGAGLGPGPGSSGSGSAGPASPFLFGASAPQPSAGLPAPAPGAPVFSLGAAPTGGAGGMGGGARPMRALPKRRK
ncbi:unnamed protein product [Tilletia controversa]|uniref:Uncharacterized protein n=3 Tax=Tilletia TaxID=13289 RepID=A0A8X7MZ61_9BASI|nr:hypothetical protein CF336_g153 [Tilletia laevis]KAE8205990.1 hypothetical protein CF328_g177 [Tilletia controversa]KAE8264899.1 hypothetical protein A4X03_0g626 [Tilletia caries]KAE8208656.1 hypothetical protein CF335_g255 [Tilletia laevis]KAE8254351.1 hypothetical protein A4X06_0g939 [Tilletia controversa]